ncbi:helix-turn-helix domain-containing protein [Shouchella lehensis]|uniref:HTH-type, AraC family transcriptional regulator n=1 Tax=Shouchella lehensis G1 TaxID=1246626 RepID=A0A060LST1_9BACI|nr:helix-turn-helix domain-containing protein [Shouchella lehensis]AIC93187.1 HTH-type, AraC family transcriptional regulator [Shouchella lehensis G1]
MLTKRGSKLLYKYIISYLLVFLVPFTIMSIVIYYNAVTSLREEIEQSSINNLEQVRNLTDERLSELVTLSARISLDPRLTPYMISHPYYGGEATDELRKYRANSAIVEELFVYYKQQDVLYSTNGSYSMSALLQNSEELQRVGREDLLADLHTDVPLIRVASNRILYLVPISPNSEKPHGTVMFFIEEATIINMIRNLLGEIEGNVYIFNKDRETVASVTSDEFVQTEDIQSLSNGFTGVETVQLHGSDYSMVSVESEVSGWTFVTVMDQNQFFIKLNNVQVIMVSFLVVLFVVGLVLAVLLGRNQYKPISQLIAITHKGKHSPPFVKGENELENLGKTVTSLYENHELLNETIDLHQPFARDQFLTRLLRGHYYDAEEIESIMESLKLSLRGDCFFVVIAQFESESFSNTKDKDKLLQVVSRKTLEDATAYAVDFLHSDSIVVMISMAGSKGNMTRDAIDHIVHDIQKEMKDFTVYKPTIGVGQLYDDKTKINRSYIEALATMEYKFSAPQGSVLFFEDLETETHHLLGYLKEEQMKYVQSIKQGDFTVADEMLADMFEALGSKGLSINEIKCICFDIINTTLRTVSELGFDRYMKQVDPLVEFKSITQLHKQLQRIVEVICKEVEEKKDSHNNKLKNDILTYIEQNYKKYEISLEVVAQEFYLSVSYLSRFIKEQTGETFTQLIQRLRIRYVKEQLTQTDQPIKDVVSDVGYKDVANFIRKFKKIEGMTPGEYRKLHKG